MTSFSEIRSRCSDFDQLNDYMRELDLLDYFSAEDLFTHFVYTGITEPDASCRTMLSDIYYSLPDDAEEQYLIQGYQSAINKFRTFDAMWDTILGLDLSNFDYDGISYISIYFEFANSVKLEAPFPDMKRLFLEHIKKEYGIELEEENNVINSQTGRYEVGTPKLASGGIIVNNNGRKTMKQTIMGLGEQNKDNALAVARVTAGKALNKKLVKLIKPKLPFPINGLADSGFAPVIIANAVAFAIKQYTTNERANTIADLMLEAAAFQLAGSFNLDDMLEDLIDGIALPGAVATVDLNAMSVTDLKTLAKTNNIDIAGLTSKAEIRDAVKAAI
jgi:hypothetical protein